MTLDEEPYLKGEVIGRGEYGIIYEMSNGSSTLAMKRNLVDHRGDGICCGRELNSLTRVKGHPFVISLRGVIYDGDDFPLSPLGESESFKRNDGIHFLMERAKCSLYERLKDGAGERKLSLRKIKLYIVQILLALEWCHNKGLIHQDIKPENILIGEDDMVKLSDFGMSKVDTGLVSLTESVVTPSYRAPEICCLSSHYNSSSDMWSLGCLVYEMYSGELFLKRAGVGNDNLFNSILAKLSYEVEGDQVISLLKSGSEDITVRMVPQGQRSTYVDRIDFNRFEGEVMSENEKLLLNDFISHLLRFDGDERLTPIDALNHTFLSEYIQYSSKIRSEYPPTYPTITCLNLTRTHERSMMVDVAMTVYNDRETFPWYTHEILFHAIDLYDRYLEVADEESNDKTKVLTRFYSCLYIFHKYYNFLTHVYEWMKFVPKPIRTVDDRDYFINFESILIKEVCEYTLYRETLYEMFHYYEIPQDEDNIHRLLSFHFTEPGNWSGGVRALFRKIMGL
jgi:serine/threonine protein kinase